MSSHQSGWSGVVVVIPTGSGLGQPARDHVSDGEEGDVAQGLLSAERVRPSVPVVAHDQCRDGHRENCGDVGDELRSPGRGPATLSSWRVPRAAVVASLFVMVAMRTPVSSERSEV